MLYGVPVRLGAGRWGRPGSDLATAQQKLVLQQIVLECVVEREEVEWDLQVMVAGAGETVAESNTQLSA